MPFAKAGRRILNPRPLQLFGEPILWVEIIRYLGVKLATRLIWSAHIDKVRKKVAQRLGVLGSGLSIRNGVLLYKQLIRPVLDYACPIWRSAARYHIKKPQVLRSKCLRIATNAPWYIDSKQIHDDLRAPLFNDHIISLTDRFDSKLADMVTPQLRSFVEIYADRAMTRDP